MNLYVSRWTRIQQKNTQTILNKLLECKDWDKDQAINNKKDYFFFMKFKSNKELYFNLASLIKEFISRNIILGTDLEHIESTLEGTSKQVMHYRRERDDKIVRAKKTSVFLEKGKLECEACNFNFENKYGFRGENYIEVHHTMPLSESDNGQITFLEDLVLLCSNCHRIIHRKEPWISVEDLKRLIEEERAA